MTTLVEPFQPVARLRDLVELGKPRLSLLVIFTAAIGVWLAPVGIGAGRTLLFLVATSALVAAANTLNCWIEVEIDGRMNRTRDRPLPTGRLEPRTALISGVTVGAAALAVMTLSTNWLTTLLGVAALGIYVLVYTPLKRITPWALFVGAVPGALPPLMGWTAATASLSLPGWLLFSILFAWQLPHFIAISLKLADDFRRGGIRVLPLVHGELAARRHLFAYTLLLVAVSLAAEPLGLAGPTYSVVAATLGLAFIGLVAPGLARSVAERWAARIFIFTLLYLPVLITALVIDAR